MLSLDIVIPLCSFHWFTDLRTKSSQQYHVMPHMKSDAPHLLHKDGWWGEDFAARPRGPPRGQVGPRPDVGLGEGDGDQAFQGFSSQERE